MLINSPNISGSLTVTGNSVISGSLTVLGSITGAITGSATSASYVEYTNVANKPALVSGSSQVTYSGLTGVPIGIVSGSSQVTYSGLTGVPSGIVSGSAQIASFGIFATTGSNGFNGSQSITGSLTVTGQVVAQTLNVQQVTSSIIYSSGSNVFGNSLANTQQFTGSVGVTGSLAVAGALSGTSGTLTGTLIVENNAITQDGTRPILTLQQSGTTKVFLGISSGASDLVTGDASGDAVFRKPASSGAFRFSVDGGTSSALVLASTGAATFSGDLTTGGKVLISDGGNTTVPSLRIGNTSNGLSYPTTNTINIITNSVTALSIASTGAATFSSSVTATAAYISNANFTEDATYFDIDTFGGKKLRLNNAGNQLIMGTSGIVSIGSVGNNGSGAVLQVTGAATFSSSVTATQMVIGTNPASDAAGAVLRLPYDRAIRWRNSSNTADVGFYLGGSNLFTFDSGISVTGAATFSSSVTATSGFSTNTGGLQIANGNQGANNICAQIELGNRGYFSPANTGAAKIEARSTGTYWYSGTALAFYTNPGPDVTAASPVLRMTIAPNGSIGAPDGTNIYNPSDLRLKNNITTISNGLEKISALNPVKFNWIDGFEPSEDGKDMLGFVAQEVYEVIPEAVESFSGNSILVNDIEIENPLRINEKFIIPVLVKAIQELKAENDTLKSRIDTLEQA